MTLENLSAGEATRHSVPPPGRFPRIDVLRIDDPRVQTVDMSTVSTLSDMSILLERGYRAAESIRPGHWSQFYTKQAALYVSWELKRVHFLSLDDQITELRKLYNEAREGMTICELIPIREYSYYVHLALVAAINTRISRLGRGERIYRWEALLRNR